MEDKQFLSLIKEVDPDYISEIASSSFLDTGAYAFNAAISGSIYGGIPDNRVIAYAGEEATGKSFFAMSALKEFLFKNPTGRVLYFDTEYALDKDFFRKRGIDASRIAILQPETLQDFRTKALKFLDGYEKLKKQEPLMMILDSLGNLPTLKEITDATEGKEVRDMTKAQVIRSLFRVLTAKVGKLGIPMIVTNHTYQAIGCVDENQFVKMNDGTNKQITDVVVGDKVKTLGGESSVTNLYQYEIDEYYEMILETGEVIKATPNHKFMTISGDWKRIDELTEEDELLII